MSKNVTMGQTRLAIVRVLALGGALAGCGESATSPSRPGDVPASTVPSPAITSADAVCSGFVVTGDPRGPAGARWTYASSDGGVTFRLEGILMTPPGAGPFPAVVISHGAGGSPEVYSARIGATMVTWGLVVIAPQYTHALAADGGTGLPAGGLGASTANVARAHKTRQVLSCLGYVDTARVAAHGHSMGAFVTGEVLGTHPQDFRVASHTAGGATPLSTGAATHTTTAERITTPYQLHHGDMDTVVTLAADQELSRILDRTGARHELRVYRGQDHFTIPFDPEMLDAVRRWYADHGLF